MCSLKKKSSIFWRIHFFPKFVKVFDQKYFLSPTITPRINYINSLQDFFSNCSKDFFKIPSWNCFLLNFFQKSSDFFCRIFSEIPWGFFFDALLQTFFLWFFRIFSEDFLRNSSKQFSSNDLSMYIFNYFPLTALQMPRQRFLKKN